MSGGGGGGNTTSTSINYSPEEAAKRAQVMDEAARIYGATASGISSAPYPGARPVPFDPYTIGAQGALLGAAGQAQPTLNSLQSATQFGLGDVLYPESNPALRATQAAAIRPITESYMDPDGIMSTIRTQAGQAGQVGGSRQGIAEGVAAGRYASKIGDLSAEIATEGYNKGLDTFGKTMALAPMSVQAMSTPAQWLGAVGAQREGLAAQTEDYLAASRMWGLNAPWTPLQNYASIVFGGASPGTTSAGTYSGGGASMGSKLAGSAMMGLGAYGGMMASGSAALMAAAPYAAPIIAALALM